MTRAHRWMTPGEGEPEVETESDGKRGRSTRCHAPIARKDYADMGQLNTKRCPICQLGDFKVKGPVMLASGSPASSSPQLSDLQAIAYVCSNAQCGYIALEQR